MRIPDRLPSLLVQIGFWIPPAIAGWVAAGAARRVRPDVMRAALGILLLGYAAAWFLINLRDMPPYIPGATMDGRSSPPKAVAWLAVVTGALVLPGSVLACVLAFRRRLRTR